MDPRPRRLRPLVRGGGADRRPPARPVPPHRHSPELAQHPDRARRYGARREQRADAALRDAPADALLPAAPRPRARAACQRQRTVCAYKGEASHWSFDLPGGDDIAWSYEEPIVDAAQIKGLVAFYDEQVDVVLDGEPRERPRTQWSRGGAERAHGIFIAPFEELSEPRVAAELAARAEERGWDGFFVWDHVAYAPPVRALADTWVTLAAVAMVNKRMTIGPLVTPLPRRRPTSCARDDHPRPALRRPARAGRRHRQRPYGRVRPRALRRGGRSPASARGYSTRASSDSPPTGEASSSRGPCCSAPSRLGSAAVGRTAGRCAARRAGTESSRSICRSPEARRGRPGPGAARAGAGAFEVVVENPPGTDPAPWIEAGATWCLTGFGSQPTRREVQEAIDAREP